MRLVRIRRTTRNRTSARGFTLIETSLAVIIIGVGVLALLEAQQAFLFKNSWSTHSSTGALLANEVREMARTYPRHDVFSGGLYFENPVTHETLRGWGPETGEASADTFDDLDDLDGVMFGDASSAPGDITMRLAGPINSFGELVTDTDWSGAQILNDDDEAIALQGWSQYIIVDKVDPENLTTTRANDYFEAATESLPELEVDQFPVRVQVVVLYQGPGDLAPTEITRSTWVALP